MVYLHVPFCESFCTYCGFFSVVPGQNKRTCFEEYADSICDEIASRRDEIAATSSVNTLYIGGGTPSVLPLDVLSRILASLYSFEGSFRMQPEGAVPPNPPRSALRPVSPAASHPFMWPRAATGSAGTPLRDCMENNPSWEEFTIEVNPEDIVEKGEDYVRGLMELGVNRVSMGIQSFDDGILRWMNRRHTASGAEEAFRILRHCGVDNISVDLIFGLSLLDDATWTATIEKTLSLGPEHISAYQLSIEEDSALEKLIEKGKYVEASEEQCRRQYDILCEKLREAGYHHYEISNFAIPGREAVHNSAYWRRVPYVGLGPGAHSLSPKGVRSWNSCSVSRYSREEEILSPEDIRIERIMLPLRTDAGLPEVELRSLAGDEPVDRLLSEGALVPCHSERSEESIRIPEDHFFTSDEIIRELI